MYGYRIEYRVGGEGGVWKLWDKRDRKPKQAQLDKVLEKVMFLPGVGPNKRRDVRVKPGYVGGIIR